MAEQNKPHDSHDPKGQHPPGKPFDMNLELPHKDKPGEGEPEDVEEVVEVIEDVHPVDECPQSGTHGTAGPKSDVSPVDLVEDVVEVVDIGPPPPTERGSKPVPAQMG